MEHRYVAFTSTDPDVVPDRGWGVLVRGLHSGRNVAVFLASRDVARADLEPRITTDGRHVVFASAVRLTPGDTNRALDVFVHDLDAAATASG
jgi:hypothetical protein